MKTSLTFAFFVFFIFNSFAQSYTSYGTGSSFSVDSNLIGGSCLMGDASESEL